MILPDVDCKEGSRFCRCWLVFPLSLLKRRIAWFNSEEAVSCRLAAIFNSRCGVPSRKPEFSSLARCLFIFFAFFCATCDFLHSSFLPFCVMPICVMPLCVMPFCVLPFCVIPFCVIPFCVIPFTVVFFYQLWLGIFQIWLNPFHLKVTEFCHRYTLII